MKSECEKNCRPMRRRVLALLAAIAPCVLVPAVSPAQQPATFPTTTATTQISTTQGGGIMLNFRDASIEAVLDQLSEVAGFIVVKDTRPEGRISLVSKQPVSPEEAVALLNTVLQTKGYAALRMERTLK